MSWVKIWVHLVFSTKDQLHFLKSPEIRKNVFCGRNVKKDLIPKELINKYRFNNLWIYNLPSAWRLLYSITSKGDVEIIAAILDWMNHKDYERLFKF